MTSMSLLSNDELSNIFYGARPAMDEIFGFLHMSRTGQPDTAVPHSSQTLALDVFGTLKFARSRDQICDHLAVLLEVPAGRPWDVHLEYVDPDNMLNEAGHKSQFDVLLQGKQSLIALECKFAETKLEPCSQPGKTAKGHVQCTGNYEMQTNPVNRRDAFCALTGKNVRYWEYVPHVFRFSADEPHHPCPFASPWYQWMRTLVMACALAEKRHLKPVAGLVHVDRSTMPLHTRIRDEVPRIQQALTGAVGLVLLRYEKLPGLFEVAAEPDEQGMFRDLQHWVNAKVNWVEARLMNDRAARRPARSDARRRRS